MHVPYQEGLEVPQVQGHLSVQACQAVQVQVVLEVLVVQQGSYLLQALLCFQAIQAVLPLETLGSQELQVFHIQAHPLVQAGLGSLCLALL